MQKTPGSDSWVRRIPWRRDRLSSPVLLSFCGGSDNKKSACDSGEPGSSPGFVGFPGEGIGYPLQYSWASLVESACSGGHMDSIPGLEKSPEVDHGNPFQYSCLENPHGHRSLAGYSPWGCKESDTTEQLSTARHMRQEY